MLGYYSISKARVFKFSIFTSTWSKFGEIYSDFYVNQFSSLSLNDEGDILVFGNAGMQMITKYL